MQIAVLINDSEYRDALVERLLSYNNDLLVNVITGATAFSRDSLILTDIDPATLEKDLLMKLKPRTVFISASFSRNPAETDYHRFFKYRTVSDLLSEVSLVYKEWHGIGYERDHSAKIISVFFENDAASYDKCMSLARQIVYRRGDKVLVVGLSYINDYGCDDNGDINRFAKMMYSISSGRHDASYGHTRSDSYGISTLILPKGKNPLAYLDEEELLGVISSMAAMFDTLILDMGTCYRKQNFTIAENSDSLILFETGRRYTGLEKMLCKEAAAGLIRLRQSGGTEDLVAMEDVINQIYGYEDGKN